MSETTADPRQLRVRRGLAFVPLLRPALYALLLLSALFTFWAGGNIAGRSLPHWTQRVAPAVFGVFLVVFAIYRFALVRAKKYPAASGFFQVGLGALIWVFLLPSTRQKIAPPAGTTDDVPVLMSSPDPRVRALAVELAGLRAEGVKYAPSLIDRLDDADARVRQRAHASLVRLAGRDLTPDDEGTSAQEKWRAFARTKGWSP